MGTRENMIGMISINAERSVIKLGDVEIAYHCDKFNTRIFKGFEDTLGFEKARDLIFTSAHNTTYDNLVKIATGIIAGSKPADVIESLFELYKVLGYGNFMVQDAYENGGRVKGDPSYMAEGWLENQEKWHWTNRTQGVCHEEAGHIAAAWELAHNLKKGSVRVIETVCKAAGGPYCEFQIEVL